jgi:hypothetical protein
MAVGPSKQQPSVQVELPAHGLARFLPAYTIRRNLASAPSAISRETVYESSGQRRGYTGPQRMTQAGSGPCIVRHIVIESSPSHQDSSAMVTYPVKLYRMTTAYGPPRRWHSTEYTALSMDRTCTEPRQGYGHVGSREGRGISAPHSQHFIMAVDFSFPSGTRSRSRLCKHRCRISAVRSASRSPMG